MVHWTIHWTTRAQVEIIFNLAIMLPHLYPIMSFKMFHVKHYNLTEEKYE
jgi:hypothetical protein